jgi:hypothetical protein
VADARALRFDLRRERDVSAMAGAFDLHGPVCLGPAPCPVYPDDRTPNASPHYAPPRPVGPHARSESIAPQLALECRRLVRYATLRKLRHMNVTDSFQRARRSGRRPPAPATPRTGSGLSRSTVDAFGAHVVLCHQSGHRRAVTGRIRAVTGALERRRGKRRLPRNCQCGTFSSFQSRRCS